MATLALHTQESVGENSTLEILSELLYHEVWERVTGLLLYQPQERLEILLHDLVEDRVFRNMALISVLAEWSGLGQMELSCASERLAVNDSLKVVRGNVVASPDGQT